MVAWLVIYFPILLVGAGALLTKAWVMRDDRSLVVGFVMAVVAVLCVLGGLILSSKIDCPVCFGRLFGSAQCSKHREARRVLGSTRLAMVIQTILAFEKLKCRFCGTSLRLDKHGLGRPARNRIDELHSMQVRTGRAARRQAQPLADTARVHKDVGRSRQVKAPLSRQV